MLALTRRVGEEIVIGDPGSPLGIIRIADIHGDKVRLAFDFPRDIEINRRELAEQKNQGLRVGRRYIPKQLTNREWGVIDTDKNGRIVNTFTHKTEDPQRSAEQLADRLNKLKKD